MSVTAGTIFQDSHVPLTIWFRAMWYVTSQKNGMSALGLQRVLGFGSYKTAWAMLHKLRRAMVRPGREPASVNRVTQYLGQAYNLAITRKRLVSDNKPDIRKLSEKDNVRQGFFERPEFLLVKPALPEYLQDLAHFGYVCGMRSGEIKSLEWATTDSESIRLRAIDAKTGKPRSVPIEGEVAEIIERRRAAQHGPWIFHCNGEQIGDFRKAWQRACVWVPSTAASAT
jgi:integrase